MRRHLAVVFVILIGSLATTPAASAEAVLPYGSRPHGHPYASWAQMVAQWYLGDASNPLIAGLGGDCGELMNGAFFMAAPIDMGVELSCDVPVGTPIVVSHAGWFTTEGIDGDTDQELADAAVAGFVTSLNELSLDGNPLPLRPIDSGVFDVISEPGSFYDTVVGVGTGSIRTALRANVVVLHPLPPGDHELEGAVAFVGDGAFSVTYHIHVS